MSVDALLPLLGLFLFSRMGSTSGFSVQAGREYRFVAQIERNPGVTPSELRDFVRRMEAGGARDVQTREHGGAVITITWIERATQTGPVPSTIRADRGGPPVTLKILAVREV